MNIKQIIFIIFVIGVSLLLGLLLNPQAGSDDEFKGVIIGNFNRTGGISILGNISIEGIQFGDSFKDLQGLKFYLKNNLRIVLK